MSGKTLPILIDEMQSRMSLNGCRHGRMPRMMFPWGLENGVPGLEASGLHR